VREGVSEIGFTKLKKCSTNYLYTPTYRDYQPELVLTCLG